MGKTVNLVGVLNCKNSVGGWVELSASAKLENVELAA